MKTQVRLNKVRIYLLMLLAPLLLTGCFTDDSGEVVVPEITLLVIDCPEEDLVVTPEVTIGGGVERWVVNVKVTITCGGEPVNNAEIKVKYGWIERAYKIKTNDQGEATCRQIVRSTAVPSGSVDFTVESADGEQTQTVNF